MRVFSRMRWWCTAEVSSNDGIGASSALESRSESTRMRLPSAMAADASVAHAVERLAQGPAAAGHAVETREHRGRELGPVAVVVDVDELGQLVVVDDRERQLDLHARLRAGLEQVGLRADGRRQRGDELLADGVERRVGDLREELLEVVEQHPRACRRAPRSACRCPSSRAPRRRCAPSARPAA